MSSPVPIEPVKPIPHRSILKRFVCDRGGATAIEYGLMVALIGLAVTPTLRSAMSKVWNTVLAGVTTP